MNIYRIIKKHDVYYIQKAINFFFFKTWWITLGNFRGDTRFFELEYAEKTLEDIMLEDKREFAKQEVVKIYE